MAISYISQPVESNPYQLPIDLGLFTNVMSIKQKTFDDNAQKIQSNIDQLGLLDVIRDKDREYLNSKINNLVNSVNSYGGIDFSDRNIMNQIESLGSDIYTDKNVINAVSSTKSIRKLQETYEKYKTDPKLTKLYSQVNEDWDMSYIQDYMANPELGAKYSGPTSPTPYTDYRTAHLKAFEKKKADLNAVLTNHGLYYSKTTNEYITPEAIMSMAADLLLPQEREQMMRDGWHLYRNDNPLNIVQKGYEQFSAKKQDAEKMLDYYTKMADAAVSDPKARINYQTLAQRQKEVVDSYAEADKEFIPNFVNKFRENPNEVYYQLYSADYFRGLGNRFSVNRTETDILPNQAEMFRQKMLQEDQQFAQTMDFKNKELNIRIGQNEEQNAIELLKIGKYRHVNPINGQIEYLDLPGYRNGHLITRTPNIEEGDNLKVNKSTLEKQNRDLKLQNDSLIQEYISKIVAIHPELGIQVNSSTGKGFTRRLKNQELIENFNNIPGLQVEDFQMFEKTGDEKEKVYKHQKKVQEFALKNRLSMSQLEFFSNQWKNFESMALGKGETAPDLVEGFPELAKKIVLNNEVISANETKLNSVYQDIYQEILSQSSEGSLKQFGITKPEDLEKLISQQRNIRNPYTFWGAEDKSNNPVSNFQRWLVNTFPGENVFLTSLKDDILRRVNDKLKSLSSIDVYGLRTLENDEPLLKSGQLQKLVTQEILDNKGEPYRNSPSLDAFPGISSTDIRPRLIGKSSDGTNRYMVISDVEVSSGDKKTTVQYKTYLTRENAKMFGLEEDPYPEINYSVGINGRSGDIPVYGNKNLSVFVNIVGNSSANINDQSSFAQIVIYPVDKNGNKLPTPTRIVIPQTQGRIPSESFRIAEEAVRRAADMGLSYSDFITYLQNQK